MYLLLLNITKIIIKLIPITHLINFDCRINNNSSCIIYKHGIELKTTGRFLEWSLLELNRVNNGWASARGGGTTNNPSEERYAWLMWTHCRPLYSMWWCTQWSSTGNHWRQKELGEIAETTTRQSRRAGWLGKATKDNGVRRKDIRGWRWRNIFSTQRAVWWPPPTRGGSIAH